MPPTTRSHSDADNGTSTTIPERETYIFEDDYLEVLAGAVESLRNQRTGKPRPTVIAAAAGLDRTIFHQIESGRATLSPITQACLVALLERRGYSEAGARKALFKRVTVAEAHARTRKPVPA